MQNASIFNLESYYKNFDKELSLAFSILSDIYFNDIYREFNPANMNSGTLHAKEEQEYLTQKIDYLVDKLYLKVVFVLELYNLNEMLNCFKSEFKALKPKNDAERLPLTDDITCPILDLISNYFSAITSSIGYDDNKPNVYLKGEILETILESTSKIIYSEKIEPKSEKQVVDPVVKYVESAFADTVKDVRLPKPTKCYKPDFAIPSLQTCVEYKFADNAEEVKKEMGQIYTDLHGYSGSKDWTFFYVVMYMTGPYVTEKQVKEELKMVKFDENWKFILVHGPGGRDKGKK